MFDIIDYYYKRFGFEGVKGALKSKFTNSEVLMCVSRKDIKFPFYLRDRTTDLPTYEQVFLRLDYDFKVEGQPKTIVDVGANIGLTSIYFANKYPNSNVLAIEPESSNYQILSMNLAPYENITTLNVALWGKNEDINLVDPGLGKWGFRTRSSDTNGEKNDVCHTVPGMTVDRIMEIKSLEKIDILKIDIEGAELEVFSDPSSWIEKVDVLIIELHEEMKSGCSRSFYNSSNGFDHEWKKGENIFLTRDKR